MAIRQLNPYLNFKGTADQAIQLHQSALGAKPENVMRFGHAQVGCRSRPPTRTGCCTPC